MTDKPATSQRLDQLLVARGLFDSRSRARDAIDRGTVRVDGKVATKAGATVGPEAAIELDDPARAYVSRAALKLVAALDHFTLDPTGLDCLDIGASTGGFTEVLLQRGAHHVVAVDVGHGQMHPRIAQDTRVTNLEGLNARVLSAAEVGERVIGCVVSDVSFISLKLALPPALSLARPGASCVLLVKPQFEAGREAIGKGGLLKDPATGPEVATVLERWLVEEMGWTSLGIIPSPIAGGDGNQEYLLAGRKP
ncbi:23S rRNA (cytidine1920-2'-O)/16S rRNA (cytidine1409-2'-O)-methyltransferase [Mycoplana sp. BE70]|uniref:TlyA family RNA methyltransferase n=1 Tax=Mycoplana sp. BE70 TaxID=2817775 RepID=UPI0028614416|nr:TlyA family RNA methyltransferase [Mycoplana sp. BE70]MDR6756166.1 23S rRNA (cytidine1920-2'-O)/16S rRNA (cytidine1409-2'-O)-methyltransferase [Mycoplana sp. BE70]